LRINLDNANGPVILTTTGNRIGFSDMVYINGTDNTNGILLYTTKGNQDLSTGATKYTNYNYTGSTTAGSDSLQALRFVVEANHSSGTQTGYISGVYGMSRAKMTGTGIMSGGGDVYGGYFQAEAYTDNDFSDIIGLRAGAFGRTGYTGSGGTLKGGFFEADVEDLTISNAYGLYLSTPQVDTGTLTTGYGIYITSPAKGTGTYTDYYGIWVSDATAGTNNYGIVIDSDNIGLTLGAGQDVTLTGSSSGFDFDGADLRNLTSVWL